jgi:uncharacterized membrane protein YkoI
MKTSAKLIVVGTPLGTLGLAGVARLVHAAQPQTPVAIMPEHRSSQQIAQASDGDGETNDDAKEQAQEQQEAAKLQSLAKITPQQAKQAAEVAQKGQASSVKLENEDGNLVYAVVIGQKEVKVDAGNGRVLYTEAGNHEGEKTEASRPRSSIQVAEPPDGDGDGETNDDG